MVAVAGRWMCALCKERALDDQIPADKRRFQMTLGAPNYAKWSAAIIGLIIVVRLSLLFFLHGPTSSRPAPDSKAAMNRRTP